MNNLEIKNPRFELISSAAKGLKEVQVIFNYKGEDRKYFIFIEEKGKTNYLKEAKKIFKKDLKDGKVIESLKPLSIVDRHPWKMLGGGIIMRHFYYFCFAICLEICI